MVKKSKQIFGLLGRNIEYSFSRAYFNEKFFSLGLSDYSYQNFDLQNLTNISEIFNKKNVKGLNVTTPFKKEIMDYLDYIDKIALQVGAVNTIVFDKNRKTTGYNTDWIGFKKSIQKISHKKIHSAIILGTGGASNAIAYALDKLNISYVFVSRNSNTNSINYKDLTKKLISNSNLIINCTPVGTFPNINEKPKINYNYFNSNNILVDLIYNPKETLFLKEGKKAGSTILNGLDMLIYQAEESWNLWSKQNS